MSEINVNVKNLKSKNAVMISVGDMLYHMQEDVVKVCNNLNVSGESGSQVKKSLRQAAQRLEKLPRKTKQMGKVLYSISVSYGMTEKRILSNKIIKPNMPFDGKGQYGGNQGSPQNHADDMRDIVRKYYPDMSDKEVDDYLKKLNSEGCGYVAMINTIFGQFNGKEEEFEKTFGFPMYDKNGELNYDALVTDFYSATDNHNRFLLFWDRNDPNEDESVTVGSGTTMGEREYRFEKYMKDHGIHVNVKNNVNVTPDNYSKMSKKGDIVIAIHPCALYDKNGNKVVDSDGGHAMTVTGVTDDGMYRVSSWGKEYYVKPDDSVYSSVKFQCVEYK